MVGRAVAALGGDRFLHMNNRVAIGRVYSFFRDQISGLDIAKIYTEYLAEKPENGLPVREREVFGKKQDYSNLLLPDQGWSITFRGARQIPDENWQRYVRTTYHDVLYLLRCRHNESGMEFDYIGTDVLYSVHVEIVDITDSTGETIRVFFDHNTMLPVHESYTWLDPDTKYRNEEVTEYDKYRDAGGVMWPYSIERQRNGYTTYQMFAEKVTVDQPIPPKTFELPSGARVLKKVD